MTIRNNLYAVILAGGSGTRFWPLSRETEPKQFLNILGERTLFQETLWRIKPLIKKENFFIVTNASYRAKVEKQIASFKIPKSNILLEPKGKNTAPSICWAASYIKAKNKNAVMIVLPSDHLILNKNTFLKNLDQAVKLAKEKYLVTLGIVPTRPETGYGYLKITKKKIAGKTVSYVQKFVEKPLFKKAKKFLKEKKYLWNSGIFIWKVTTILDEFKKHLPDIYFSFRERNDQAYVRKIWHRLPSISIDYGILEKAHNIVTIPSGNLNWSDLGSWEALTQVLKKNKNNNILKGDTVDIGSKNTSVFARNRLIATIGLENIIIVDTSDSLLVCHKDLSQKVKDIVAILKAKKRKEHISY